MTSSPSPTMYQDRLLVVDGRTNGASLAESLRRSYPTWAVQSCNSYMSAIVELSRQPAQAIVADVDSAALRLEDAVAGLREAAGEEARLVLVCRPDQEPLARMGMRGGANDYVISPVDDKELDAALGYVRRSSRVMNASDRPAAISIEELGGFTQIVRSLEAKPTELLGRIGAHLRTAFGAKGATVVVEGAVGVAGDAVIKPVLAAPVSGPAGVIGQLLLAESCGTPYSVLDARKLEHYATIVGDVLEAASRQRHFRALALTDECSGLPNRRYLFESLDDILNRAQVERFPVTVLLFDVDNFKEYNDRFGHAAGDEVIRACGELFRKQCREQDIFARYGGDEFAVVFWDPQGPRVAGSEHPDCALAVLDRVRDALRRHEFTPPLLNSKIALTISGGLATYPWDGHTREELIARADEALMAAKRAGKNRVFVIGKGLEAARESSGN